MSTLPAASSFSGSAGSAGTCGRTSRPTARKSPWAIAEYSAAWSALGKKSSITVNGFVFPGPRSRPAWRRTPTDRAQHGSEAAAPRGAVGRRRRWRLVNGVSSRSVRPRRQAALGEGEGVEAGDREHEQHHRGGVGARGLKAVRSVLISCPKPAWLPPVAVLGLGDEGADHADRQRDPRAAERRGQRRRQLGEAERLPARGVERAQQLQLVGVDGAKPSTVVTSTGKKQISAITTSLGKIPKPHQKTSSGAITAIGTACEPTASG